MVYDNPYSNDDAIFAVAADAAMMGRIPASQNVAGSCWEMRETPELVRFHLFSSLFMRL